MYSHKLRKSSQVLLYNRWQNPLIRLKNTAERVKSALEEICVNAAFDCQMQQQFGFRRMIQADRLRCETALTLLTDRTECNGQTVRVR